MVVSSSPIDDELIGKELKQIEADDQAIQTILLGLPEGIYAVNSCETAQEIWLRVQQMMKGSDIGIQEKKTKLFNEWERQTNTDGCGNQFRQYAGQNVQNLNGYNDVQNVGNQVIQNAAQNLRVQNVGNQNGLIGVSRNANHNPNGNGNLVAGRAEGNTTGYNADLDEIEEVNANCILMTNLQQASTSGTQTDQAPVYDSDGSAEVHKYENFYDYEIFNMFTQEDQYTELLEPIPEPLQVPQNDNNVISEVTTVEQSRGTVEQHPVNAEETCVLYDSLYHNLAIEVEKLNTVNHKLKETNVELTTKLAIYKNQEKCFGISQEKYVKLKRCYQKSVYQEQYLSKKLNALHLSFEAAKFFEDFKSLAKKPDESLAKHKALELEIERLLRSVVSQDIMSVVQNNSVGETSNLQTELERTKERFENCIIKKENEYAKL
nr:hypothetical protein [Tanacetum cinerariifolium]